MTINKLTDEVYILDNTDKINEIIDELNAITVDSELSSTSENPVQNKIITAALSEKQDLLTAGLGISISEEGIISTTGGTAEWGNIQGTLSEQTDLQEVLDTKQDTSYLVTTITSEATDTTYPSAKAVYDAIDDMSFIIDVASDTDGDVVIDGDSEHGGGGHGTTYVAGDNISITDNTISATYTAGNKISINNGEIAFNDTNFLPDTTVIHVELDGSGDFTNLDDAINYLYGKWSNGTVTIQFGSGTFDKTELTTTYIDGAHFNIPRIAIIGAGITETIYTTHYTDITYILRVQNASVLISNMKFANLYGNQVCRGVASSENGYLEINNVHFDNIQSFAVGATRGGETFIQNSVTFTNCQSPIFSEQGAVIKTSWGATINATNINVLFSVNSGLVYGSYPVLNETNVQNRFNQTNLTITNKGLIMVSLQ